MKISMTDFVENNRHFGNPNFSGTKISGSSKEFLTRLDKIISQLNPAPVLVDGYAPFCKHLFVENFTGCLAGVVPITSNNRDLLKTEYNARREEELPVLSRFFLAKNVTAPQATFLDIILYSAEHLKTEGIVVKGDWGIVSINAEMAPEESPMPPITMLRNALGKDEGGSGVTLDREAYLKSVEYWKAFATVQ
jgi:hypothetical protein